MFFGTSYQTVSDTPLGVAEIRILSVGRKVSFHNLSETGTTILIHSSAELSDDCVSKFTSLVRAREVLSFLAFHR